MYQTSNLPLNLPLTTSGRQRRSTTVRRLGALATAVALTASACGGGSDASTASTLLPEDVTTATEAPVDTEVPTTDQAATTIAEPASTEAATTEPPVTEVPAETASGTQPSTGGLTLVEIIELSKAMMGPTDNAFADLSTFGPVNEAILTPAGSEVFQFGYAVEQFSESNPPQVTASAAFSSASPAEDLLTFYETELTAAGFTKTGGGESTTGSTRVLTTEFDIPGSELGFTNIDVAVYDREDERLVEVRLVDKIPTAEVTRLGVWANEIPGLEAVTFASSDVRVTTIGTINFDLGFFGTLPQGGDPVANRDAFVAGLGGAWTLNEEQTADADADAAYIQDAAGNVAYVIFNDDGNVSLSYRTELVL